MTIMDALGEFADATSVNAAAGTALIGNQIDLTLLGDRMGGQPVYLNITVDTAIITGGSAGTVRFQLASDDSASISTSTATIHLQTKEFVTDDTPTIPVGSVLFSGPIPEGAYLGGSTGLDAGTYERYIGILCVTTTTTTTAGKINAWLSQNPLFPRGVSNFADATN